jgi:hypothetical protein
MFISVLLKLDDYGRDRIVVEFTTTYAIGAYHHWCCEFDSRSGRDVQHYVIEFVSDLRQVSGFLLVLRFPQPIKLMPQYNWNIVPELVKIVGPDRQNNGRSD